MNQPVEQAMRNIADIPCRRSIRAGVGSQPAAEDAFGNAGALRSRGTGLQIGQPAKTVDQPFHRRRQARAGKFDIGNRRFQPVEQEMSGAQRRTRRRITGQGVGDSCSQARRHALGKGIECARAQAKAIGHADQPLAGADLGW